MKKIFIFRTEDGVITDVIPMADRDEAIKFLREEYATLDDEDKEYVDWEDVLESKFVDYHDRYGSHIVHQMVIVDCD